MRISGLFEWADKVWSIGVLKWISGDLRAVQEGKGGGHEEPPPKKQGRNFINLSTMASTQIFDFLSLPSRIPLVLMLRCI